MSRKKVKHPNFEKIHPNKFYKNVFYNPDMDTYIAFSDNQLEIADNKGWSDILSDMRFNHDYPSAYHVKSEPEDMFPMGLMDVIRLSIGPGGMRMQNMGRQKAEEHKGMSFRNINPDEEEHGFLVMDETDVAQKQMLGQMFLADGSIATRQDYEERRNNVFAALEQDQPQGQESFVRKLRPLLYDLRQ